MAIWSENETKLTVLLLVDKNSMSLLWSLLSWEQWRSQAGHTGARALATRGCAPPVQALLKIIGAECTVINRKLGIKSAQRC